MDSNPNCWNVNLNDNYSYCNWNNNPDNDNLLLPLQRFSQPIKFAELIQAYLDCRKTKRWKKSAIMFELNLEQNLVLLYKDLLSGEYKISPSIVFVVQDPKYREVYAAHFRDRIIHHFLINRLELYFEEYYDDATFNCRKHRGGLKALQQLQNYLKDGECIIGLDIKSFFPSIPKKLALNDLLRFIDILDIEGKDFLKYLIKLILENDILFNSKLIGDNFDKIPKEKRVSNNRGIPIGDLTSQFIANFILTIIDIFIRRKKVKHVRYVDDFRIICKKSEATLLIKDLFRYLEFQGLEFNPNKIYILDCIKGCPFIGYFVTKNYILPGKRIKHKIKLLIFKIENKYYNETDLRNVVNSYLGFLIHCRSYKIRKELIDIVLEHYPTLETDENLSKIIYRYDRESTYTF